MIDTKILNFSGWGFPLSISADQSFFAYIEVNKRNKFGYIFKTNFLILKKVIKQLRHSQMQRSYFKFIF